MNKKRYSPWAFIAIPLMSLLMGASLHASSSLCEQLFRGQHAILKMLSQPKKFIPGDITPKGEEAMVDLRALFLSLPGSEFNALWKVFSKEDLFLLHQRVEQGHMRVSPEEKQRLDILVAFVEGDTKDVLWRKDNGALESLHREYEFFRGPGYVSRIDGAVHGVDLSTLYSLRMEVLRAALKDVNTRFKNLKWYEYIKEFFIHPYFTVKRIRSFHDQVRQALGGTEAGIKSIDKEVVEESQLVGEFTPETRTEVEAIKSLLMDLRSEWIKKLSLAYGQDITTGGYQMLGLGGKVLNYHDINSNIKMHKLLEDNLRGDHRVVIEKALERFNQAMDRERKLKGKKARTIQERSAFERQVANFKLVREAEEELGEWKYVMDKDSSVSLYVNYSYQEMVTSTEHYTDHEGKSQTRTKVEWVTRYSSKWDSVTYYELFVERLSSFTSGSSKSYGTITSVSGREEALSNSEAAAQFSKNYNKYRNLFYEIAELLGDHQSLVLRGKENDGQLISERLSEIRSAIVKLNEAIVGLRGDIERNTEESVLARWSGDSFPHFQSRTKELLDVLIKLNEWYSVYEVQLAQGEIDPHHLVPKPDDSKEWSQLRRNMQYNIGLKVGLPLVAGSTYFGLVSTGYDYVLMEKLRPFLEYINLHRGSHYPKYESY